MLTSVIRIGNSRGVRIPKVLLEESGLGDKVELKVKRGEIRITTVSTSWPAREDALLSERALGVDWNRPEEEEAWKNI